MSRYSVEIDEQAASLLLFMVRDWLQEHYNYDPDTDDADALCQSFCSAYRHLRDQMLEEGSWR